MPSVLAIDIGGTKFAAARVLADGTIEARAVRPTPAGDAEDLFAELAAVAAEVGRGDEEVCGVGSGGPMAAGGETVSPLNIPGWRDFPLRGRLQGALGMPVHVDNDAKALALAEGWLGAAVGVPNFVALVVSTGIGGGVVLDGRLLEGTSGNAGHLGHVIVEPGGRPCTCGARGCLEAEASGTAIAQRSGRPAAEADATERERAGRLVGRGLASVANLLDLQLAVAAGSVALGFGAVFFEAAQAELDRSARIEFARGTRIVPGALGSDGPLVGAAAVGLRGLGMRLGAR